MSQNLWADLEQEFEEQDFSDLQAPKGQTVVTDGRMGFQDQFALGILKGLRVSIACVVLAFVLMPTEHQEVRNIYTAITLIPLAWLLKPLAFSGRKEPGWRIFLAPLLLGGLTEILLSVPLRFDYSLLDHKPDNFKFWHILQKQSEALLSWPHLGLYLLAGLAYWVLFRKLEDKFFWLDPKPSNQAYISSLRWSFVLIPALFFSWVAWQHQWTSQEQAWLDHMASKEPRWQHHGAFELKGRNYYPLDDTTLSEEEFLKLTAVGKNREWTHLERFELDRAARKLVKSDSLKQPELVVLSILENPAQDLYFNGSSEIDFFLDSLIPYLIQTPLEQLQTGDGWIADQANTVRGEWLDQLDRNFYYRLLDETGWQLGSRLPENAEDRTSPRAEPMTVFGQEFDTSPVSIYARWRGRREANFRFYLSLRKQIRQMGQGEAAEFLGKTSDSLGKTDRGYLARGMNYSVEGDSPERLASFAYFVQELRKYRKEHESWPKDLAVFCQQLNINHFPKYLDFDPKEGILTYRDPSIKISPARPTEVRYRQWRLK